MDLHIEEYKPEWRQYFEMLNRAWIEKYFKIEPADEHIFLNVEEDIIHSGGTVLFALVNQNVIGCVAIKKIDAITFELAKMAVDENFKGYGVGKHLVKAAVEKMKSLGAQKAVLFTHSSLKPAIHIYQSMGFKEVPLSSNEFERADIMMQLEFNEHQKHKTV